MAELNCKESSNLGWARYDEATQTLQVDFRGKDGSKSSTYSYPNVSPEVWANFICAESKGRFFAYAIRPHFQGRKIWPAAK